MNLGQIEIGTFLSIEILKNNKNELEFDIIKSNFLGYDENGLFYIRLIKNNLSKIVFNEQDAVLMYFVKDKKIYSFEAKYLNSEVYEEIDSMKFKFTTEIEQIQRREFYRLKTHMNVSLKLISFSNKENEVESEGIIQDISGGGIGIITSTEYNKNDLLECTFTIYNNKIFVQAFVKWVKKHKENVFYKYELGLEFYNITDEITDKIVKYIFEEQRKLLSRKNLD